MRVVECEDLVISPGLSRIHLSIHISYEVVLC